MAAEETRMAAAIIPHLPPALVFHAGQPYDLWETWMAGAIVIRRSRNRELRCRNPITRHLLAAVRLTQGLRTDAQRSYEWLRCPEGVETYGELSILPTVPSALVLTTYCVQRAHQWVRVHTL